MSRYLPEAKVELEKLAKQFAEQFGITYYDTLRQFDEALCDLNDEVPIPIRSDSIEDEKRFQAAYGKDFPKMNIIAAEDAEFLDMTGYTLNEKKGYWEQIK